MKIIHSISEYHRLLSLSAPAHPLISVVDVAEMRFLDDEAWDGYTLDFYVISLKRNVSGTTRYGRAHYDYDKGLMTFIAPHQVLSLNQEQRIPEYPPSGYSLFIHPDFLFKHSLASIIREYGFFSYSVNEALHLSEKEEGYILDIFGRIQEEYQHIDLHTQDIILAQVDLLLGYSNRFYQRQFITRKTANHNLLDKMDQFLEQYFEQQRSLRTGMPTVEAIAKTLQVSPHYLSDLLRSLTGKNAQQYIQIHLIEKAKVYLSTTNLNVAEIAYLLGFEYPQSFNKLFKKRMNVSPLEFRKAFK
ncbi:helix-turn-helix domain-containing protein [Pedobacter sp. AW1-32]|uniref:helix-turn-helix domain-containing protein n=1 Tax=Pedobacter sp. AW1-32 TaxID=3383026 RepID=UPI003FF0F5A5